MQKSGKIDKTLYDALPATSGTPAFLTEDQTKKAKDYLAANWAKAIG
jgi:putative spermidine/putrescine transport system substrate-binding protein